MSNKNSYYSNLRMDIIDTVPDGNYKSLLEIGGGDFTTLSYLAKKYQAEATGVDLVDLEKNKEITFFKGSIEEANLQGNLINKNYDLIIANDVIEHLVSPSDTLAFLYSITCRSGGYLVVSVPNIRQLRAFYQIYFKGTFPKNESGLFDKTHLQWFCNSDITTLIKKAGFEVVECYNQGRFVPKLLKRTSYAKFFGLHIIVVAKRVQK